MKIILLAAVADNGVIGRDNALPFRQRSDLKRFRKTYRVGLQISQPAGLRELVEGKVDLLIDCGRQRHPGYKFDRLNPDLSQRGPEAYLVCPEGTAECPEIIAFRSWLLESRDAVEPLRVVTRRTG